MNKVTLSKKDLLEVLSKMITIAPQRSLLPIYDSFLFDIRKTELFVYFTTADMQVKCQMNINTVDEFKFAVPYKLFFETIKLLPNDAIDITIKEAKIGQSSMLKYEMTLKNGKSKYKITCENHDVYPIWDFSRPSESMNIGVSNLISGIEKTSWLVDEMNKVTSFSGTSFRNGLGKFCITGALSEAIMTHDIVIEANQQFSECIIPKKTALAIKNILTGNDCKISISDKKIRIANVNCEIISVLIPFKYPDVKRFSTVKSSTVVRLNRTELSGCLNRLKLYAASLEETAYVNFDVNGTTIMLTASDNFNNNFGEEIITIQDCGIASKFSVNLTKLSQAIYNFGDNELDVFIPEKSSPLFVSSIGIDGPETEFIISTIDV